MNKEYWEIYYSKHREPNKPSSFALFCVNYVKAGCTLIELGCGNGRDSIFFSREVDLSVIAVDQCQEELSFLEKNYKMENLTFRFDDFTRLKKEIYKLDYVYSRFTLHAIEEVEEDRTLSWSYNNLKNGGKLMLELRSVKDELCGQGQNIGGNAYISDHYRRFAEYDKLLDKLLTLGFDIEYSIEDKGLAVHNDEDPVIIRIIAKK